MARETKKNASTTRKWLWRGALILLAIGAVTGVSVYLVHRYLIHDPKFVLARDRRDSLAIEGLRYGSRAKVQRIFAQDADHSVFSVPLEERRRRLLAIDWVEDASVSRIWPDRLAVRIQERKPLAFVEVQGTVMLIDGQGMLLEPPAQAQFSFPVLNGVRAEDPPERRMDAVRALLDVEDALGASLKDVSEVNAGDPGNISIVVQMDGRVLELILGEENLGSRYRNFLKHYPEIHKRSPQVRVFDLRLDDRITVRE